MAPLGYSETPDPYGVDSSSLTSLEPTHVFVHTIISKPHPTRGQHSSHKFQELILLPFVEGLGINILGRACFKISPCPVMHILDALPTYHRFQNVCFRASRLAFASATGSVLFVSTVQDGSCASSPSGALSEGLRSQSHSWESQSKLVASAV